MLSGWLEIGHSRKDDLQKLQISAPVQPGNGGGPLLDQSGRLLGVVVQNSMLSASPK